MSQTMLSLIPSFESKKLHALSDANNQARIELGGEMQTIKDLDNPLLCGVQYLPYLAYANKADLWSNILYDDEKRNLIMKSVELHSHKGTVWAILEVLKAIGLSSDENEAIVLEYRDRDSDKARYNVKRDGTHSYDAAVKHNDGLNIYPFVFNHWAEFVVILKTAATIEKAALARELVEIYKPVRSFLLGFVFDTLQTRDGSINYDAQYKHGVL